MTVILFDDSARERLLPLTYTRPVAAIRTGILTIAEKWARYLQTDVSFQTVPYLSEKYPSYPSDDNLFINGSVFPDEVMLVSIGKLKPGELLLGSDCVIAARTAEPGFSGQDITSFKPVKFSESFNKLTFPEDIFRLNDVELRKDFRLLTHGRKSAELTNTNTILGNDFFAEEGAEADCAIFNTRQGPVYLGKNSQVWEGSTIRGSFALCENSQVKMGAKIYGMTTIGPYCRVGGEINNSVIFGYSSKGHEGYLGNSVVAEWCNIGADTNNSNLKNNYAEVGLWDYSGSAYRKTGLQFCGLIMADHVKCGINTMFNTGTVAGVCSNIFGGGFQKNFIPDFSWGGPGGEEYNISKLFETITRVYERRNMEFKNVEKDILEHVFQLTEKYRRIKL